MRYVILLKHTGEQVFDPKNHQLCSPIVFTKVSEANDYIKTLPIVTDGYIIVPLVNTMSMISSMLGILRGMVHWLPNCQLADDTKEVLKQVESELK